VSALEECRRKFALNLKSTRDASLDPVFASAARLKKLKNRHLWAGSFIHEAVGSLLKSVRQGEPVPAADAFVDGLKIKMREQFLASKENAAGAERLFEHEYRVPVAPEIWRGHWDTVEAGLRGFLNSKWLSRLSSLGPECWKAVDELLEFDVNGIKAYVKIDCAIESEGKFFLIDWKTSAPNADAEPSLLVSALYAHEVWGAEPDQIEAMAVCLLDGRTFHAAVNEDSLMNTHLRIEEESAALEEAKSTLGSDPFSVQATSSLQSCRRCHFQVLCHPRGIS
jgi:hypothetical protein